MMLQHERRTHRATSAGILLAAAFLAATPTVLAEMPPTVDPPGQYTRDSILVAFNGQAIDGTTANTYVGGVENTAFRQIFETDLQAIVSQIPSADTVDIQYWFHIVNGTSLAWDNPNGYGFIRDLKEALEALPYVTEATITRPPRDFEALVVGEDGSPEVIVLQVISLEAGPGETTRSIVVLKELARLAASAQPDKR